MEPNYCVVFSDVCFSVSAWAAWVQAVGSVAAVYFAGRIANRQLRYQREDAVNARIEELAKLHQFFDHCHSVFVKLREWNSAPRKWREEHIDSFMDFKRELELLARRTKEVPILVLAAPQSMSYIVNLERDLEVAAGSVIGDEADERYSSTKEFIDLVNDRLTKSIKLATVMTEECLLNMQSLKAGLDKPAWKRRLSSWKQR